MNQPVPPLPPARRNPVASFFIGLWDVMNFTRRLILNLVFFGLLFLLLVMFVIAAGMGAGASKSLQDRTTLVIAPEGRLVEQFSADPVSRALAKAVGDNGAEEIQLRDLLRVIESAKEDKKIERVVLELDKLQPSGFASLREVAAALQDLRASGKQLVAYSESMGQSQYLLAAQADEVYLDPMGSVVLEGLGRYRQYFRTGLQDKLGVDVHLFKVGEYKSAAEPYVLDAASPASKEADLFWMNDVWQRYLGDIAKARRLDPAQLAAGIDTLPEGIAAAGGDTAKFALQQKLVTALKTREEFEDLMIERGVADEDADGGFRNVDFGRYLALLDARRNPVDSRPQVAVVVAAGEISGGDLPAGRIGGESTSALLRAARDDDNVKAVVLRVDSPGGEVFASEQIRREVVALQAAGKPVVVSMGDRCLRWLLDQHECRSHLRRSVDHHRFDRHLRHGAELQPRAGQDRRAHRWCRHHPFRRCIRCHPPDGSGRGPGHPVGDQQGLRRLHRPRRRRPQEAGRGGGRGGPRPRVERCAGQGTRPGRCLRWPEGCRGRRCQPCQAGQGRRLSRALHREGGHAVRTVRQRFRWQSCRCLDAVRFGHGADDAGTHDAGSGHAAALRRERGPRKGQRRTGEGAGVLLLRVLTGNAIE